MDPAARVRLELAAALESEKKTIVNYVYNPKDYCIPQQIRVPPELRIMNMDVAESAYVVIQSLLFFHGLRSQRFLAMCPDKQGPIFSKHATSIRRLQEWEEQSYPPNPTLAQAAKIPAAALGFHLDQRAYDAYVSLYMNTLQKFYALEWTKYCRRLQHMKNVASQYLGPHDYSRWLFWWNMAFKPAMEKWHIFLGDMDMPSWEDSVDELHDLIIKCVEDSDDKTAAQFAQGICSCQIKIPGGLKQLPEDPNRALQL